MAEFAPDINVPWGACAHPDGRHLMISGNPGYGYVGGGIGIYDLESGEKQLLPHTQLIPDHCVLAMAALPSGDLVGGTSVAGGHGTTAVAKEGQLFILDWATKRVGFRTVPVPGASEVGLLRRGPDGLIYGVAGRLFVFDPVKRAVVHTADLSAYGARATNGLDIGPDGNLYLVMSKAILRLKPPGFAIEKLADTPAAADSGIAVLGGRVYFGVGSHLWSAAIP